MLHAILSVILLAAPNGDKANKEKHDLGTKQNPIRCHDPSGERWYLNRLRDAKGNRISARRLGSTHASHYGFIMDIYHITTQAGDKHSVLIDMYHYDYVERRPIPGFRIAWEHWARYEYRKGLIYLWDAKTPFTGPIVKRGEKDENNNKEGRIELQCQVKDGRIVDKLTTYWESGKQRIVYLYNKDGEKHGITRYYRKNGKLWAQYPYDAGRLTGKYQIFDKAEKLNYEADYIDHLIDGKTTKYHPNGKIRFTGQYKKGKRHGEYREYDEQGKLLKTIRFENGQEVKDKTDAPKIS